MRHAMESAAVDPAIVHAAEIQMCRPAPKRLRPGESDGDELVEGKRPRIAGGDTHRATAWNYVGMSAGTTTPLSRAFRVEADPHPWLAELRLRGLFTAGPCACATIQDPSKATWSCVASSGKTVL